MKSRLLKLCSSALIVTSLTILLCGCKKKGYFEFEGKIYKDSYDFKDDYGYIYLEKTNQKVAKLYEELYLKMIEFDHKKQDVKEEMCHTLFYEGNLNDSTYTYNEMYQGYMYLTAYHPDFFWLGYILDEDSGDYSVGISRDYAKASERKRYEKEINAGIKKVDKLLEGVNDEFDKIKIISDYIMDNMTYAFDENGKPEDAQWAHSITGFFDRNTGVCESYAKVFKLLCDRYNIGNIPVTSIDHIWNLVEYEKEWYFFDLTWDDDNDNYVFFGKTPDTFTDEDHIYHEALYELPDNMATEPLSIGNILLKENGNTIYSSHSMKAIMNKFNNGKYEIEMICDSSETITQFHINSISSNYETLTISSNKDENNSMALVVNDDINLTKDLTLENLYVYATTSTKIILNDATLYLKNVSKANKVVIEGDNVVIE